jgi:tetratricopeptide (TPR) repeat protein
MLRFSGISLCRCLLLLVLLATCAQAQNSIPTDAQERWERAKALADEGKSDEARRILEPLAAELRPRGASVLLWNTLTSLTDLANLAGEYDKAAAIAREYLQVCLKLHNRICEARAHNDIGLARSNAGNYADGALELEAALKLAPEANEPATTVMILNNLGNVYYYQAKYTEALRTYEEAAGEVEKNASEAWAVAYRDITRLNLATLYQRVGNSQHAIDIYRNVMHSPAKPLTARETAHVYANLGILYRRLGDAENALKAYHDAENWYAKQKDSDGEIGVLKNVGILQALDLDRLKDALATFDKALQLANKTGNQREVMQIELYRGETLDRMGRTEDAATVFHVALDEAVQLQTVEEQWKAVYGLGRIAEKKGNLPLAEEKYREAINKIESLRSKLQLNRLKTDFFSNKRDVYDALIKLLLGRNDLADGFEFMERSRARSFQDRFFGQNAELGSLSVASLRARLSEDTALVEFWIGADEVAALWITRDSQGVAKKHFSSQELEDFAELVSRMPGNLGNDWRKGFEKIGALAPPGIVPFSEAGYRHLLIVPDSFLSMVPFELMPAGSGRLLLEDHDVTYLPSAVLLLRGAVPNSVALGMPWQRQLVAFGDPAVVGSGESSVLAATRNGGDAPFGSLPSSRVEIEGIARMAPGRAALFLGAQDRKREFFDFTRSRASILHVSTHAIADMDNPERSRLLFSPDRPGQPNNFVFLKELYDESLDLRGVSLATLSACDTERGRLVPGEGVQAFSRALLSAGSRSALTTLWRVPDQPTSEFMQQFYYQLLKKHKDKAEALRLTKLEFLNSGGELSHPKYWAAFVINGDGNAPVPPFIPWQLFLLALILIAAVAIVIVQLRDRARSKKQLARPVSV